ncbi:TetR/AcrR family transcriptional regulator [Streptomyces fuscichromogenes]|uniref:TetR family transcriptional regulator n=1 Tax=Streptomyces fuscichromogenes TaxID=1324013 RepID=A0A917XA48_9ACTN|nr:TetR/AcrR family transcriptional regulator [Streptomyces fuscichromogenes]GGM99999.1 TetR family transcriptional regulator [Streptomyces fuscichromogenes]
MESDRPEGLRERKKRATHRALQSAAVDLFRRHGPDAVTVESICAEAGVSPRTFFNYFATKDEAAFMLEEGTPALIERRITARPAEETPLEAIRAVFVARLSELATGRLWLERMLLLRERPELLPRIVLTNRTVEDAVTRAVAARTGLPEHHLYVRTTGATVFAALQAAISCWQPDSGPKVVTLVREAVDLVGRGLPVPPRTG